MNKVQFHEEQYFKDTPFVWIIYGIPALIFGLLTAQFLGIIQDDAEGFLPTLITWIIITVILVWFTRKSRLVVDVQPQYLHLQHIPFHFKPKQWTWNQIQSAEKITYQPLREFGGWGIRYGGRLKCWAYTVFGNEGVMLTFKDGKKILIGSKLSEGLEKAIQAKIS